MFWEAFHHISPSTGMILLGSLALAFAFEAVNGFHDTANAVATVIYTRSLKPTTAVIWSGLCNMLGIFIGGVGVAFSIVHLLPVELLVNIHTGAGLAMILSLLLSALLWNLGTWRLGLPASSSHALIGSILGVAIANSVFAHKGVLAGVNIHKMTEIGLSLLISPTLGFLLSALLLVFVKRCRVRQILDRAPKKGERPPIWVRGILCATCTGVSLAHGSNDGQKGMGLVMLILIGLLPAQFALNLENANQAHLAFESARRLEVILDETFALNNQDVPPIGSSMVPATFIIPLPAYTEAKAMIEKITEKLRGKNSFLDFPAEERWQFRQQILRLDSKLVDLEVRAASSGQKTLSALRRWRKNLRRSVEYVPKWVIVCVALALGLGTMVGWKRIVVTVGEKIGKSHLTYGQGASAELIAMTTIGLADAVGLPVSTTHVLSSGVAGTMWANRSGINGGTAKNILLAWLLTLPATILLSGSLFLLAKCFLV